MRIVVTGMGIVSPIGIGVDQFWTAAVNGVSGIRKITGFDASSQRSRVAGERSRFAPPPFLFVTILYSGYGKVMDLAGWKTRVAWMRMHRSVWP